LFKKITLVLVLILPLFILSGCVDYNEFFTSIENNDFFEVANFIDEGANVNKTDRNGYTPVMILSKMYSGNMYSKGESFAILELLLENGADLNYKHKHNGNTALHYAVESQNYLLVLKLINNGANVNIKNDKGLTPLGYSLETLVKNYNDSDSASKTILNLLINEAEVNFTINNNMSPLDYAIKYDKFDLIQAFINAGADVNEKNVEKLGLTTLNYALRNNREGYLIYYLNESGSDIFYKNENKQTSLMIAAKHNNHIDIIKYLLRKGLDVNAKDTLGKTPLFYALENDMENKEEIIIELLKNGADKNIVDRKGNKAVDYTDNKKITNIINNGVKTVDRKFFLEPNLSDIINVFKENYSWLEKQQKNLKIKSFMADSKSKLLYIYNERYLDSYSIGKNDMFLLLINNANNYYIRNLTEYIPPTYWFPSIGVINLSDTQKIYYVYGQRGYLLADSTGILLSLPNATEVSFLVEDDFPSDKYYVSAQILKKNNNREIIKTATDNYSEFHDLGYMYSSVSYRNLLSYKYELYEWENSLNKFKLREKAEISAVVDEFEYFLDYYGNFTENHNYDDFFDEYEGFPRINFNERVFYYYKDFSNYIKNKYSDLFFKQKYLYIGGTEFIGLDDGHIYNVEFEYDDILKPNDYINIKELSYGGHERTNSMVGKSIVGIEIIDTISNEKFKKINQLISN
jgi:ankyrin repeat protein